MVKVNTNFTTAGDVDRELSDALPFLIKKPIEVADFLLYETDEDQEYRMSVLVGSLNSLLEQEAILDYSLRKSPFQTVLDRFVQCQEKNLEEIGIVSGLHQKVQTFKSQFLEQFKPYMSASDEAVVYPPFCLNARTEGEADIQFMDHIEDSEEEKSDVDAQNKRKKKKGKKAEAAHGSEQDSEKDEVKKQKKLAKKLAQADDDHVVEVGPEEDSGQVEQKGKGKKKGKKVLKQVKENTLFPEQQTAAVLKQGTIAKQGTIKSQK